MWYNYLLNNTFIKKLYNEVPELKGIIIENFEVLYYGRTIKIIFELPKWVDVVPKKWELKEYNSVMVEIDFWDVQSMNLDLGKGKNNDVNINILDEQKIEVIMEGGINAKFIAEAGIIQKVEGYVK